MSVYQNKSGLFVGGTGGGGGGPSTPGLADELATTADPVNVSSATPPVAGQALIATDGMHAVWRVPGLKYDPAIRFNVNSLGEATIEPGTWGFVYTYPPATTEITVFIVSSLAAPPVDSRFGLYVSPSVTVPVTVTLVGASQIMGLDGVLGPTADLLPGAMYEWVFYHEDGAAIWGLVSDTTHLAKRLAIGTSAVVNIQGTVNPGDVLTAVDFDNVEFQPPSGGWLSYTSGTSPSHGQWVLASNSTTSFLPNATAAGQHVAIYATKGTSAALVGCTSTAFQVDRNIFESGETAPLRDGSWYEWVSIDFGESFRWVPVGGSGTSARPPLEYPEPPYGDPVDPNQWVLTSTDTAVNFPNSPKQGDVFGIYADVAGSAIPANGTSLQAPDLSTTITFPANLPLTAGTYYEWIFTTSDSTWHPRQNLLMTPARTQSAYKEPVRAVATVNITLSGLQTIDGVSLVANDRVLLTNQSSGPANGIYVVSAGAWVRATDADSTLKIKAGIVVPVTEGTTYDNTLWHLTTNNPITLDTTTLTFFQFGGNRSVLTPIAISATNSASSGSGTRWASYDHVHGVTTPYKDVCRVVATANQTLSGLGTIDGVSITTGDRVLCVAQSSPSFNGIYFAQSGSWVRTVDASTSANMGAGTLIPVSEGSVNADTLWCLTTNNPISLGSTNLSFSQVGGPLFSSQPSSVGVAGSSWSPGTSTQIARADHVHELVDIHPWANGFRLSNNSSTSTPSEATSSTVYLIPHIGARIGMFDGSKWLPIQPSANPSAAVAGQTAGVPCDVFAAYVSLTSVTLELVAWTNATTRAVALAQQNGVWIKSGAATRRYLGTILPDSATSFTHRSTAVGSATKAVCSIWNQDNRINNGYRWQPSIDTWSPTSGGTWEIFGGGAGPQIELVTGQLIDDMTFNAISSVNPGAAEAYLGIGLNTTSSSSAYSPFATGTGFTSSIQSFGSQKGQIGRNTLNMLTRGTTTAPVFYGAHGSSQAGLSLNIFA